ncbi:MAG: hypothetical protein V4542_10255 [Pseudomonadota bacterium]
MTTFSAIEAFAGIAFMGFGLYDALEGGNPMEKSRGWLRSTARGSLVLGLIYVAAGVCLLLDSVGVINP